MDSVKYRKRRRLIKRLWFKAFIQDNTAEKPAKSGR